MKTKILLLTFLMVKIFSASGQVSLEATYDSAATNLYIITLEVEGEKYVKIQRKDSLFRFIRFYNLNHSLWKTIDCNSFPMFTFLPAGGLNNGRFRFDALYITEHLFDTDDEIEFLYSANTTCPQYFTAIYNEDGTPIFMQDSAAPLVPLNIPIVQKPIYNTVNGTKMILSFPCSDEAKVYSLAGTLTTSAFGIPDYDDTYKSLSAFPNPSTSHTTIEYNLPQGTLSGEIIIYDLQGTEIKKYAVDNTFHQLLLDNSELSSGTYLYTLFTNGRILESNKIIVLQ